MSTASLELCKDYTNDTLRFKIQQVQQTLLIEQAQALFLTEELVIRAWGMALCSIATQNKVAIGVLKENHTRDDKNIAVVLVNNNGSILNDITATAYKACATIYPENMCSLDLLDKSILVSLHVDITSKMVIVKYNGESFAKESMNILLKRVLHNIENMLDKINNNETTEINDIPKSELAKIMEAACEPEEYSNQTIISLFKEHVNKTPENIAIWTLEKQLSYLELDIASDKLALHLLNLRDNALEKIKNSNISLADGKKLETPLIALYFKRTAGMVISMLATQKAGFGYVPIDIEYNTDRIDYILKDSGAIVTLSDNETITSTISKDGGINNYELLNIDNICYNEEDENSIIDIETLEDNRKLLNSNKLVSSNNTLYVLYTSGSTGVPKGVCLSTRAALSAINATCSTLGAGYKNAVILACTTYVFDLSVVEFYCPLISGSIMKLAPNNIMLKPKLMQKLLEQEPKPTWIQSTPSLLKVLLTSNIFNNTSELEIIDIVVCGELLRQDIALETYRKIKQSQNYKKNELRLYNAWGPTEAAVYGTARCFHSEEEIQEKISLSIGKALYGRGIYLLEPGTSKLVPYGAKGEICVSGPALADGYLNLKEKSDAVFVKGIHPNDSNKILYRCGDICRWRPDNGELEIFGRIDNQVKIRGFRVELGEVEATLVKCNQDKINECAVIAKETDNGTILIAYLAPEGITKKDLNFGALPKYMHPSFIVTLESLPKNQSGKINRKALPDDSAAINTFDGQEVIELQKQQEKEEMLLNPLQKDILKIIRAVLYKPDVKFEDNIFQCGATSISCMQIKNEVESKFSDIIIETETLYSKPSAHLISEDIEIKRSPNKYCLDNDQKISSVLCLHKALNNQSKNLFIFHPAGGVVYVFYELIGEITRIMLENGVDFNIYVVQDVCARDKKKAKQSSIEEMCNSYWEEIKGIQPEGEYFFAGHSVGGLLATEVAGLAQLESSKNSIGNLFLLDANFTNHKTSKLELYYTVKSGQARQYVMIKKNMNIKKNRKIKSKLWGMISHILPKGNHNVHTLPKEASENIKMNKSLNVASQEGSSTCGEINTMKSKDSTTSTSSSDNENSSSDIFTLRVVKLVSHHIKLAQKHGAPLSILNKKSGRNMKINGNVTFFWALNGAKTQKQQKYVTVKEHDLEGFKNLMNSDNEFDLVKLQEANHLDILKNQHSKVLASTIVQKMI